ncbi:hypothetical protein ZWY2020_018217 [Hordeum vulgare]|nr:hypothetical protein ZWY2020_018217 [Hordeum vulgare]
MVNTKEIWALVTCMPDEMRACGGFANNLDGRKGTAKKLRHKNHTHWWSSYHLNVVDNISFDPILQCSLSPVLLRILTMEHWSQNQTRRLPRLKKTKHLARYYTMYLDAASPGL